MWELFNKQWFKDHQTILLWLCNVPVVKIWFRWILRIHKDCPKKRIIELAPHYYTVPAGLTYFNRSALLKTTMENPNVNKYSRKMARAIYKRILAGKIEDTRHLLPAVTTDFRTHWKFSKRLYYAFYPLWMMFHIWDFIADPFFPKLSFGFATLTAQPVAGANSPCDGITQRGGVDETMGTIRAGAGTLANRTNDATQDIAGYTASATTDQYAELIRGAHNFDTSPIGAGGTISAATESIEGTSKADNLGGGATVNIYDFNPAATNDLAAADYGNYGSAAYCDTAIAFASWSTTGYNDFAFNATGLAGISKTGITSTGTREAAHDVANVTPSAWSSGGFSSAGGRFADTGGTSSDPKLVVTYTPAAQTFSGTDTFAFSDTKRTSPSILRQTTITLTDVRTILRSYIMSFVSTLSLSDTLSAVKGFFITVTSTLRLTDALATLRTFILNLSSTIRFSDTLSALRQRLISVTSTISLSDTLSQVIRWLINATDTVNLTDRFNTRNIWNNIVKSTAATWSNVSKNVSSWVFQDKNEDV